MIIDAEFTAGLTIEEAIREALDFAARNSCLVGAKLNDVPMLFFNSSEIGKDIDSRVEFFKRQYLDRLENGVELETRKKGRV